MPMFNMRGARRPMELEMAGGVIDPQAGQPQGIFGQAFGGLGRFNERNPMMLAALGRVISGDDPFPVIQAGMSMKKDRRAEQKTAAQENATKALAKRMGFADDEIEAYAAAGRLGDLMKPKENNYINAGGGQLFNETTGEWISAPEGAGGTDEFGLQVQTGVDKDGNPVLIQVGKNGKATRTVMPEGVTLSKAPIKLDAGTHFVLLDPVTRQPVGQIPKENYQEAFDSGRGAADAKTQSEAAQALPGVAGMAALIDSQIQSLKTDPYLPSMVGPTDSWIPNISGDAARVQSKIDQLQGGAFLQARQMLKGGGAITDIEGQKAEAAFVRMNQAQNDADFIQALDEFNAAVQQGLRKLQGQAGQPATGGGNQRLRYNPQTGELE